MPLHLYVYREVGDESVRNTKFSFIVSERWYFAGKNISFQARTFCSVPEHFVPSVHF
jgi:hypothetical protein